MPQNPMSLSFLKYRPFVFPNIQILIRHFSAVTAPTASGNGVALYLQRARIIDSLRLRLRLHSNANPFPLPPIDSFVAVQLIRSSPSTDLAVSVAHSLPNPNPHVLHSLAKRLAYSKRIADLHSTLNALNSINSLAPIERLRYLAIAGDLTPALETWSKIKSCPTNRHHHPPTEAYNLVINLYANHGLDQEAVHTFLSMISKGANPNLRTYTVIIEHLVRRGKVEEALEVFGLLPGMRVQRSTKMYNVLAGAVEDLKKLEFLVRELKGDGILPGRVMREVIGKLRAAGFEELTEEFVGELLPNEKIGYAVGDDDDDDDDEKEGEGEEGGGGDGEGVHLKMWIDPAALARALNGWDLREVKALESAGFVWTSRLVCKILRALKKSEPAWEFFCWVAYQPGGFAHDQHTVTRMISILAKAGHVELVERLLSKLKAEKIQLTFTTVRLIIDFYGLSKKPDAAIKIYRDADSGSICGSLSESNKVILSSSLLRTLVKCKKKFEVMEEVEAMIGAGILLDLQTFSGLMHYFAAEGDLKSVHKLSGLVRQCGLEPDGYMHQVLIRAYCKNERAALALRVFEDMMSLGLLPDKGTKGLLVKSLWKEEKRREAAMVEERCEGLEKSMPVALPGHVWTVSEADFKRVCDIYSGCLKR